LPGDEESGSVEKITDPDPIRNGSYGFGTPLSRLKLLTELLSSQRHSYRLQICDHIPHLKTIKQKF
jgi:hypothetical protein